MSPVAVNVIELPEQTEVASEVIVMVGFSGVVTSIWIGALVNVFVVTHVSEVTAWQVTVCPLIMLFVVKVVLIKPVVVPSMNHSNCAEEPRLVPVAVKVTTSPSQMLVWSA